MIKCEHDNIHCAVLTLLDLSAAFDSVDHQTLLRRLQTSYDLGGAVIDWFASYLKGRTQYVRSSSNSSSPSAVLYGVPRGSVLGPILFLLYILLICCSSSAVTIFTHTPLQMTLRFMGFATRRMLTLFVSVCLSALMTCQNG